jgi:hypothetical protein
LLISDKEVFKKILHLVPDHLEQVAISIETLLDLNNMSIEIATRHLRAVKERKKKASSGTKERRLLLTEEDWMAWLKVWEGEGSGGGRDGMGRGRGKHGERSGGGGRGSTTDSNEESPHRANPPTYVGPVGSLATGPNRADLSQRSRPRPMSQRKMKEACCLLIRWK